MMIGGLAFVATLSFEIPFAKLEAMLIGGKYFWIDNLFYWHKFIYDTHYNICINFITAIMGAPTKKRQVPSARNTEDLNLTKKEKVELFPLGKL